MRVLVLCLLCLMLAPVASRAQTCPAGMPDLTQQKIDVQVIPNGIPPAIVGGQVTLGYDGCLRFNTGSTSYPFYAGQVTLLFFDTSHNFLTATGQQLTDPATGGAVRGQDVHLFGSQWQVPYALDLNAISPLSVMEFQITLCKSADLNSCDAETTSTWLWTGQYFVPSGHLQQPPHPAPAPAPPGIYEVSDKGPPCAATQPREGAAIAQATLVATDNIPATPPATGNAPPPTQVLERGSTTIGILGCLRFKPARAKPSDPQPTYPYYGLGEAGALLFDNEGNVLTPIGDTPGKPYGQFIAIFPAASAAGVNKNDPSPILNPDGAGIHAFGFQYNFPLIAHGDISPYATLLLIARGCTDNVTSACTGPVETFVHTVRTCFAELKRPSPHGGKPEDCPSAAPATNGR